MKVCPKCGFSNPDDAYYCTRCGQPLYANPQGPMQSAPSQVPPLPNTTPSSDSTVKAAERRALLLLAKGVNYFGGGVGFLLFLGIFVIILAGASQAFINSLQQPPLFQGSVILPRQVIEQQIKQEVSDAKSIVEGFFLFIILTVVSIYWAHKGNGMIKAGIKDLRGLGYDVKVSSVGSVLVYIGIALSILLFFLFGFLGFNMGLIFVALGGIVSLGSLRRVGNALGIKGANNGVIVGVIGLLIYLISLVILLLHFSFGTFLAVMLVEIFAVTMAAIGFGVFAKGINAKAGVGRVGPRKARK